MHWKAELGPNSPQSDASEFLVFIGLRLKKLRRERELVERAIVALTEIFRVRQSRARRSGRT